MSKFESLFKASEDASEKLIKARRVKEDFDGTSVFKRLSPFYWMDRKMAGDSYESKKEDFDRLLENVYAHADEIKEEANNYVDARKDYEETHRKLAGGIGVDSTMVGMNDFVKEIDLFSRRTERSNQEGEVNKDEITEWYKKNGRTLAVMDLLTPKLPIVEQEGGYKGSTIEVDGSKYRTLWGGERIPRLEVGKSLEDALVEARERGVKNIFRISTGIQKSRGGEVYRESRYAVLDEEMTQFLQENEGFLRGSVPLFPEGGIILSRAVPWMTIDYECGVVKVEELENIGETFSAVLRFKSENLRTGDIEDKSFSFTGTSEELKREITRKVVDEEWGVGIESSVVSDAVVVINGKEIPWEEFVNSIETKI